jgi:hypothetical protein
VINRRLAVVLATPPGFNPGMAATELALSAFMSRHGLSSYAEYFRLQSVSERLAHLPAEERRRAEDLTETGLAFRPAHEQLDRITSSEAVLFWADFLHMAIYVRELEPLIAEGLQARGFRDVARELRRLLLLADADDATLARTLSFGTTLLFNTLHDEEDSLYASALRRFLRRARRVWVRDALSAARVAHVRGDYEACALGVDCALLLTRDDALRNAAAFGIPAPADGGSVLTFFGREPGARQRLAGVADVLAAALAKPIRGLPWGDRSAFPVSERLGDEQTPAMTVHALLNEVAHASLVVTDTYHLALTAWNFGVPAVCGFPGHTFAADDVSSGAAFRWRDKREIFYSQYDALDFLVRPEELVSAPLLERRTQHVARCLRETALVDGVVSRIHAHAAAAEDALARELTGLLGVDPAAMDSLAPPSPRTRRRPVKVLAIVCIRNEEVHVEAALRDLIGEGLDVVLLDHDSTDRSAELAEPFIGRGLLAIERLPWTGEFSIAQQLAAKARIIDGSDHDWIVHADADEWLSAPEAGKTLLEGLREVDAEGYNAVHFNEFVFVPPPGEDMHAPDYRRRSRRYYFFRPHYPYLLRAWKHRCGLDNRRFAGHLLSGSVRPCPRDFPLRHYIVLNEEHARRKYLGRPFAPEELAEGFHYDRVLTTAENLRLPDRDERLRSLAHWSSKDFDTSRPVTQHYWQWTADDALSGAAAR